MIEAAMYVALGFCTAGLIGLAILPAFYRRAARLTEEALRAVNPSSYAEVRAAQDQARARHAVELRRVEQLLDTEREKAAKFQMAASRLKTEQAERDKLHTIRIEELEARIAAASDDAQAIDLLTSELKTLRKKLADTEKDLAESWAGEEKNPVASQTDRETEEDPSWLPATDTMMLATITGLEAEVATLKAKLANYEPTVAGEIDASLKEAAKARLAELEGQLVDTESKYISAQAEVTRLSLLLDSANASETDQQKALDGELKNLAEENARHLSDLENKDRLLQRMAGQIERLRDDLSRSPALLELRKELKTLSGRISQADRIVVTAAQPAAGQAQDTKPKKTQPATTGQPATKATASAQDKTAAQLAATSGANGTAAAERTVSADATPDAARGQVSMKSANIANAAEALVSRIVASNRGKNQASADEPTAPAAKPQPGSTTPQASGGQMAKDAAKAKKKDVA